MGLQERTLQDKEKGVPGCAAAWLALNRIGSRRGPELYHRRPNLREEMDRHIAEAMSCRALLVWAGT